MRIHSNVHTHSTFSDGENTPEEMVQAALALGFTGLGFSSHAPAPYDPACPGVADETAYIAHIRALAARYKGKISVACGIEQDAMAPVDAGAYDYVIGSAHYLRRPGGGAPMSIDGGPENLRALVENFYRGDALALVRDYYAVLTASVAQTRPTIVGHFDLITKFNQKFPLFDESDPSYRAVALEALDAVLDSTTAHGGMLEVNTGAMARGWRDAPYPAPFLLRHTAQRGAQVIITGDSHSAQTLDYAFPQALRAIRDAGFTSLCVYGNGGFTNIPIEV